MATFISRDGTLKKNHLQRIEELRSSIVKVKINNSLGCIRRNAVNQLYRNSRELLSISLQLCNEAGIEAEELFECKFISTAFITEKVNDVFCVDINDASRKREVVKARQAFHMLCKMFTGASLKSIAAALSNRKYDHTTVIHSIRTCKDVMDTDPHYFYQVNMLIGLLNEKINQSKEKDQENNIDELQTTDYVHTDFSL